jgi:hypothetical protein
MKTLTLLVLSTTASVPAWCADAITNVHAGAQGDVVPLLQEMVAAANAHDLERHIGFYAHEPSVTLIVNGEAIVGWDAIRAKQSE